MESPNKGKIWTTKQGKELDISKMDYNHILNCINMLKRNHLLLVCNRNGYYEMYETLTSEIEYRDNLKKKPMQKFTRFQIMDLN